MITTFKPRIHPDGVAAAAEVLSGTWIGTGPKVEDLEAALGWRLGIPYPLCVSSGTAALELALHVLGIGSNNGGSALDEVITTPLTFVATNNSILRAGAKVVFADVDEHYNIDPSTIVELINIHTRAVMVVHMYGHPCQMDEINALGIPVIEDCAHAFDAEYRGVKVGGEDRNIHCYSFQAVKNFTTAGGGMIGLPEEWMHTKASRLRWFGIDRDSRGADGTYDLEYVGGKFNMTDINASIGLAQLAHMDEDNEFRGTLVQEYNKGLEGIVRIPAVSPEVTHAWHAYTIRVPSEWRDELILHLRTNDIQTMILYKPHTKYSQYPSTRLPQVDSAYKSMITLPLHMHLTIEEVKYICRTIRNFVREVEV